jgi:hypothetical protein
MRLVKETQQLLTHRDVLLSATWRYLVQAIWLFFPPILFLLLAHFAFWHVTQGKDLMMIALEDKKYMISPVFFCFILALIFWVIVTWYSTRIVAKAKEFQDPDRHAIWKIFLVQTPRILAFTCITILLLAFFQLNTDEFPKIRTWICYVLLGASYFWYYAIFSFWETVLTQREMNKKKWLQFLRSIRLTAYVILAASIGLAVFFKTFASLIFFLLTLQVGLVLLLILRREIDAALKLDEVAEPVLESNVTPRSSTWKKIRFILRYKEDRQYFNLFQWVSFFGLAAYITIISSLKISLLIGTFPFLLLAFGVLVGIGNIIATVSVFARFNFHMLFFLLSLMLGKFVDPHYTTIPDKANKQAMFSQRQTLKEYFVNWINDPSRKKVLEDSSTIKYPVYFVIANGGASRSGYWVASVLSKLQDTTKGKFGNHLFCLSGASGGSVGNATFFNLLRAKDQLAVSDTSSAKFWNAATHYLESDFLSFTLTRLLGRDIFRHIIPSFKKYTKDRAEALAYSLERAGGENSFLYDSFATRFSDIITQKQNKNYGLPIICINTTRMQDGSPGIISNISINENYFNGRIDVLSLLRDEGKSKDEDMKLSTAVVLGASFPYISPAGRIESQLCDKCPVSSHYFVDGGYFDNSGAGVVNEMLIALNDMLHADSSGLPAYAKKLEFYVLHISNSDHKDDKLHRINPFTNDLLAPAQTILGSYGTQTLVNDQRLKNYLISTNRGDTTHYVNVDLYSGVYNTKFSMNWVISRYQRNRMNQKLLGNATFLKECGKMLNWRN